MDDRSIIEHLRHDADRVEIDDTEIDPLIRSALLQGHRRRTRRRVSAALSAVVVAGVVGTVVATGVPAVWRGSTGLGPASGPVSAVPSAGATSAAATPTTASAIPTGASPPPSVPASPPGSSVTSEPPTTTGLVSGTPNEVRRTLIDALPSGFTVVRSSSERDAGAGDSDWENTAAVTVQDAEGTSYLFASIGNGSYGDGSDGDGCLNLSPCHKTTLADGGIIWVTGSPGGDKAGPDRNFTYDRPDGGHISLMERTFATGNGPVTRPAVPLTDAEGRALVASTRWDDLFQG